MLSAAASPEVATLAGGAGSINSVALAPDGKTLATGDGNGNGGAVEPDYRRADPQPD